MSLWIQRCGWGQGLTDSDPPISGDGEPARRSREHALRHMLEVLSDARLAAELHPEFVAPNDDHVHARFVRLLVLIRQLIEHELPRLRRLLRRQTTTVAHVTTTPRGGRVDFLGTLQRAPAAYLTGVPGEWVVQRTQYFSETSINVLVAAILHRVTASIATFSRHVARNWGLRPRENDVLQRAVRELRRFFEITPLGGIAMDLSSPIERMTEGAVRRRAEFTRIESLVRWWREFTQYDLSTLRNAGANDALTTLSVHGCYELMCTTALILALRDRLAVVAEESEQRALRFRAPRGMLVLQLAARPEPVAFGRSPTAVLELQPTAGAPVRIIVEARNAQGVAAQDVAARMVLQQRAVNDPQLRLLLLTPSDGEPLGSGAIRWLRFASQLRSGATVDAVNEWQCMLDELLDPIEEGV